MNDACFMISRETDGGGNVMPTQRKTIRRSAAIGDVIACTVVADKLVEEGFSVAFQAHPMIHPVLRRHPKISMVEVPAGSCNINLDGAYERNGQRRYRHFYSIFIDSANSQLASQGISLGPAINCRPRLFVPRGTIEAVKSRLSQYPRPWVFICPRSESYKVRQIPDAIWQTAAKSIHGTCFWLGFHPAPEPIVDLQVRNVGMVIDLLTAADLLVTVDTGPMHIANALGIQVLAICQSSSPELHLSDQSDFLTIAPSLDCLNCQQNVCPKNQWTPPCQSVDAALISAWANDRLRSTQSEDVSAVIPILHPDRPMLERCVDAVLPQVQEVLITMERGGTVPDGLLDKYNSPPTQGKVRVVVKPADRIGFGRNVNFGVRHSRGKYVLVLNDDLYLAPDAVQKLKEIMGPKVGVVGHLTYYPDGTIYHAGKPRQPGNGIGFPHIDLRQRSHTIKRPVEMENTNGASILFRRQAFYDAQGYDEGYFMYAEDDDICMKIRLAGWQVWYTPHATGVHDEHQESRKVGAMQQHMGQSNARFGRKWGEYFRHNANNPGLGNFDYLRK